MLAAAQQHGLASTSAPPPFGGDHGHEGEVLVDGWPVPGSMRWWRSSPSTVQCRLSVVDVAMARQEADEGQRLVEPGCSWMPTVQPEPGPSGAVAAHPQIRRPR